MIAAVAESLDSVALEQVGDAQLLDRIDTKYLLPAASVPALLESGAGAYRVLTFGGRRISRYRTEYFDTPDLRLYREHLIGREPRCKIRIRTYVDEQLSFLEMKWKTVRGRTVKTRTPFRGDWHAAVAALCEGPSAALAMQVPWDELRPSIEVDYSRLTLVSRTEPERVTVDLRLAFRDATQTVIYPGLAVAEVKQQRVSRNGLTAALRRQGVRELPVSKYCLGVARLWPGSVKTNGYRWLIQRMNQIGGGDDVILASH